MSWFDPYYTVWAIETTWAGAPGWMIVNLFTREKTAVTAVENYGVIRPEQKYRVRPVQVWR